MEQRDAIRLYLDRDTTGQNTAVMPVAKHNYKDESGLYKQYKDLTIGWLIWKSAEKNMGQKLRSKV
jgi:hypothetical protein